MVLCCYDIIFNIVYFSKFAADYEYSKAWDKYEEDEESNLLCDLRNGREGIRC